jgi:hypothetical protein
MPDQREIDRAAVISAMSRAKQNEAAQATMLVRKALSPTKPVLLHSSPLLRQTSSNNLNNIASSCPSNLSIIEKQPDVILDTTASNNTLSIEETDTN